MILTGNRQEEIIARATKRLVTAMIYMITPPQKDTPVHPLSRGLIIENKKPMMPLTAQESLLQNVEVWRWNDECVTPLQSRPDVLVKAVEVIKTRTKRVNEGALSHLDQDEQKAVFDSKDIISRATGLPPQMHFDFIDAAKTKDELIEEVPFVRLKNYLKSLESNLETVGGQITSADIAHSDYMSAFDYYEISFGLHHGNKFTYGDVMLSKGREALRKVAANRAKPDAKPH